MKTIGLALLAACTLLIGCGGGNGNATPTASSPAATVCPTAPSGSFTANSGETLRMTFRLPASPNADVLVTEFGFEQASGSYTYRLLNGSTVLGTVQGGPTPFWK